MGRNPEPPPDPSVLAQQMAEGMLGLVDVFGAVFEAGRGVRAKLEAEGWSPTMAEQIAGEFVLSTIRTCAAASVRGPG